MDKFLTGRQIITFLAVKYHNDWMKIYTAIKNKELVDSSLVHETIAGLTGDYVTIIDSNYPDSLKKIFKPPFVVFLSSYDRNSIDDLSSTNYLDHFDDSSKEMVGA